MAPEVATDSGLVTGFQAINGLWVWMILVVGHVLLRLARRPGADPIRPSGPIG